MVAQPYPALATHTPESLETRAAAAGRLGVSTRTVDRLIAERVLDVVRIGRNVRIRRASVDAIIENGIRRPSVDAIVEARHDLIAGGANTPPALTDENGIGR